MKTTFYVLQCDTYHFILGLTLLSAIDGGVFCGSRRLEYTLGKSGGSARATIPLATRSVARASPCYHTSTTYVDPTTPAPPHADLVSIPEGWAAHCLEEDTLGYVQEGLVDVSAWAALNNETTQYHDDILPPCYHSLLDCSLPTPPTDSTVSVECTEVGCTPPTEPEE